MMMLEGFLTLYKMTAEYKLLTRIQIFDGVVGDI